MIISAMKQALEALDVATTPLAKDRQEVLRAKEALRQAIEQAEKQEPSLWFAIGGDGHVKYTTDSDRALKWKQAGSYRLVRDYYTSPVHAIDTSQERVDETAKRKHNPVENDYDKSIHSNPDALAWAKFFMATVKEKEWCIDDIDEGLMFGWFANAMMAMHDHVKREHEFECPRCGHCCREWVGLTDEEKCEAYEIQEMNWDAGYKHIEAKLKEKNGG